MEANWIGGNSRFNWNYNPQNQINSSNVQNLVLSWLFPLPAHPVALQSVSGGIGMDSSPMIINGTIYFYTQAFQAFAIDAANGNVLWTTILPILPNSTVGHGIPSLSLHSHDGNQWFTTTLFNHTPAYWISAPDQKIYALNAFNGKIIFNFTDFTGCIGIAGNNPGCVEGGTPTNLLVDEQRGIVITSVMSGSSAATGRCVYWGWNVLVNPVKLMWTAFCTPPQPGGNLPLDPYWDIKQVNGMKGASIFKGYGRDSPGGYGGPNGAVDLKALSPAVLNSTLYDDWGYGSQSPACKAATGGGSTGSTNAGWGSPWVLGSGPTSGMAFVNTNNRDPYTNACMPGPDLWSASILAINETNGNWIWGFQGMAHEMWDYDCSWYQAPTNETINGVSTPVIMKTCKAGYIYELNALTGAMLFSYTPTASIAGAITRCHWCYPLDPLNKTEMSWQFFNPSLAPTIMFPSTFAFESESAYSPTLNLLYSVYDNIAQLEYYVPMNSTNYKTNPGNAAFPVPGQPSRYAYSNASVLAVNMATGQLAWSYFIPTQGIRGGMAVSGNILYITLSSGDILMFDATTGKLVRDMFIGGPLNQLSAIGATASGKMEVIVPVSAGAAVTWGTAVPGDLVALTLQTVPAATTNTVTSTSTVSAAPLTSTTTTTATVTSTASTGVSTTTLYAVAGLTVVFIIATGFLALRGRPKPAP